MDIKDTAELMISSDYKDRFKAEYIQTKIRYDKLNQLLAKLDAKTLDFEPNCSKSLLMEQKHYMSEYLRVLEIRAEIEAIYLP